MHNPVVGRRIAKAQLCLGVASWLIAALLSSAATAQSSNPNALWQIVHGKCVPNVERDGNPSPCAEVDLTRGLGGGYALLKDLRGASQFLLIPTKRLSGIESPVLLAPRAPNYFADAWKWRMLTEKLLGRAMPRDTLSLALNSEFGRTQDQLHIHIDCIRPDVRKALRLQRSRIGRRWTPLYGTLAGHRYRAMRIAGRTLAGHNPVKLLAAGIPGARSHMGRYTLVVAGMVYAHSVPGFVVLEDRADLARGNRASGEELQDHTCALAR